MDTENEIDDRTTRRSHGASLRPGLNDERVRLLPDQIGGFTLEQEIGRGGIGVVYRARSVIDGELAAVKLVGSSLPGTPGDDSLRLIREALALRELDHEYVVKILGAGRHGHVVYMAMEFVNGQTLKDWQSDPRRTLLEILTQYGRIGLGLAAAHDAGLVHRDFKPNNVMIDQDERPRVLDFGLARRTVLSAAEHVIDDPWEEITQVGTTLGTPSYMAPEQVRGEPLDARADQFAFCIALYEAVVHEHPFEGRTGAQVMSAIANDRRRRRRDAVELPPRLCALLERGLSPERGARFASMADVVAELVASTRELRSGATPARSRRSSGW